MKTSLLTTAFLFCFSLNFAQVGINNVLPKATLDVTAKAVDGTSAEGVIAPRLTGDQLKLGDSKYGSEQTGTLVYVTSPVTSPSIKTVNVVKSGYYMFDGSVWKYAFGSSENDGSIDKGEQIFYHGTWGSANLGGGGVNGTISSNWLSSNLFDLPILGDKIRLDGYFSSPVSGSSSIAFNPRLVNISNAKVKIWVSALSNVDRFAYSNIVLNPAGSSSGAPGNDGSLSSTTANGGWVNLDNGIYQGYGDNQTLTGTTTANINPTTPSQEVEVLDIIMEAKWYRVYFFIIVDNKDDTNVANMKREVYLSIQRLY
ncbi:hypothetical protein LF887_11250 [Chryseobacterium sp. MEBOG06]|uniref:hypothetical protein n=1 Tax=Chryseobacterium sp. MEBOG06 TaxID=2879938 RepID=UPI001F490262|nr:hypothetical protein [Chryseobacterium sp. MEBOG06]UKB86173.1 hypothetical protein LF887_11250 [Chryseobacterium sp. MEBOG06]